MNVTPVPNNWYVEDGWVIGDDKIRLYLDHMYDGEYAYVSKNRYMYPLCVQTIIAEYDSPNVTKIAKNIKLKIRALTDYDMYIADVNAKKQMVATVDRLWNEYKTTHELERPLSYADGRCDRVYKILQSKRDEFALKSMKLPMKTYVTPSKKMAAAAEDPRLVPLRKEIVNLENEFEELKKKITQEDDEWEQSAKYEFAIQNEMYNM
jgi:hypothetical protein